MPRYRSSNSSGWLSNILIGLVVLVVLGFAFGGCGALTSQDKAINAAKDAGYIDIKVEHKSIFFVELLGCGKEDNARFTVSGINPRGERREFYVCAGVLKGGTIRSK